MDISVGTQGGLSALGTSVGGIPDYDFGYKFECSGGSAPVRQKRQWLVWWEYLYFSGSFVYRRPQVQVQTSPGSAGNIP